MQKFVCFLFMILTANYKTHGSRTRKIDQRVEEIFKGIQALKNLPGPPDFQRNFNPDDYDFSKAYKDAEEYDFILVGSGATGAIVASRLSEIKQWKVLLLEAGSEEDELLDIPGTYPYLGNTKYDWGYKTVPQKNACLGGTNRECVVRVGRGLGGGTLTNGFYYTHGNPDDYDRWASLGLDGWSWKEVFPYLKKPENTVNVSLVQWDYHGRGGNLFIEDFRYYSEIKPYLLEAGKQMRMEVADYNGKNQLVFGIPQSTTDQGKRFTIAHAYLNSTVRKRKNLFVRTESQVIKIIIDQKTMQAGGVEYLQKGKLRVARAKKEVILSAGPINTPQLLMLSGIGPKKHLEAVNITCLLDLAVGRNLNNHLSFWGTQYTFSQPVYKRYNEIEEIRDFVEYAGGPLTNIGLDGSAYFRSRFVDRCSQRPNIEFQFSTRQPGISGWSPANQTSLVIEVNVLHPKSRGTVTLRDKNPLHYPLIDLNYLSDPNNEDIEMILEGIHKALEVMNTDIMQSLGPQLIPSNTPQCNNLSGDDFWRCDIRYSTAGLSHFCGSAKMGPKTDKGAVVDAELKVYGIQKLRIADASVLPVTISGHLMSPCNMIGERAAVFIKSEWKQLG